MPDTHHPTIGEAVLFEFVIASAYALLIIIGTGQPETFFGMAVEKWINLFVPAVRALFALVPVPDGIAEGSRSDAVWVYRHILAACILIACGHFACSRRHWRYWSETLKGHLSAAPGCPESRSSIALSGFQRMILGFVAALFLALFVEAQVPAISDYLFRAGWTYVRAPLLLAAAYSFGCYAAALRVVLTNPR